MPLVKKYEGKNLLESSRYPDQVENKLTIWQQARQSSGINPGFWL